MRCLSVFLVLACCASGLAAPPSAGQVDLTAHEHANFTPLRRTSQLQLDLTRLFDDDPLTAVEIPAPNKENSHYAFAFRLGSEQFAVDRVELVLETQEGRGDAGMIEFFSYSPRESFRSLRLAHVGQTSGPQTFQVHRAETNWFILKIEPAGDSPLRIRRLAIYGETGPFAPPADLAFYDKTRKALATVGLRFSGDESRMLEDARDGHLDQLSFAEAALIASGVLDSQKRAHYLNRLEQLAEKAKQLVKDQPSREMKGLEILRMIRRDVLRTFTRQRHGIDAVLDDGHYNCLSSTILFVILARKCGLDCRGVLIPGHAFAVLYDGHLHVDFETTSNQPGVGFGLQLDRDVSRDWEQRKEFRDPVLLAALYENRFLTVAPADWGREELLYPLAMLGLHPHEPVFKKYLTKPFGNWMVELIESGDYETSQKALKISQLIAPRVAAAFSVESRRDLSVKLARALLKQRRFEEAFATLLPRNQPDGKPHEYLNYVVQEWVLTVFQSKGLAPADALLVRLQEENPALAVVEDRMAFFYSHVGIQALDRSEYELAWKAFGLGATRLPEKSSFPHNAKVTLKRWVADLCKSGKWQAAIDACDAAMKRFPHDPFVRPFAVRTWDQWGATFVERGEWAQAAKVYANAASRFPADASFPVKARNCRQRADGIAKNPVMAASD